MAKKAATAAAAPTKKAASGKRGAAGEAKGSASKVAKPSKPAARDAPKPAADDAGARVFKLDAQTTRALTASLKRRPKSASPAAGAKGDDSARKRHAPQPGCVVYVGHLPHGFYEEQLEPFFSQFGVVRRLRVARAKNTAKPKGYAFVEFEDAEVASIVAKAMHNYIMFDKLLKVHVMADEDVHAEIFRGAGKTFKPLPTKQQAIARTNRERSTEEQAARVRKLLAAERRQKRKLADAGIDYDFDGYAAAAGDAPRAAATGAAARAKPTRGEEATEAKAPKASAPAPKRQKAGAEAAASGAGAAAKKAAGRERAPAGAGGSPSPAQQPKPATKGKGRPGPAAAEATAAAAAAAKSPPPVAVRKQNKQKEQRRRAV